MGDAGRAAQSGVDQNVVEAWVAEAWEVVRNARRESEVALAGLAHVERLEARARVGEEEMGDGGYCQCMERMRARVGGESIEDAVELSDDDDVQVLAVSYRPMLVRNQPAVPYVHGNFIRRFPAASGENSCGSVCNPPTPAADDEASS